MGTANGGLWHINWPIAYVPCLTVSHDIVERGTNVIGQLQLIPHWSQSTLHSPYMTTSNAARNSNGLELRFAE